MPSTSRQQRNGQGAIHDLIGPIMALEGTQHLVHRLAATRQIGRPGYPVLVMVACLIAQVLHQIPTITKLVRVLKGNRDLREACGIESPSGVPSEDAFYRFKKKLREGGFMEQASIALVDAIKKVIPDLGTDTAIDSTDIEAWCNVGRKTEDLRDRDASWGRRNFGSDGKSESYFGYKLQVIVDADHQVPLTWKLYPAGGNDFPYGVPVYTKAAREHEWFSPAHAIADKGYDTTPFYRHLETELSCRPIIPMRDNAQDATALLDKHGRPFCEVGPWEYAGTDYKNKRTKWRCPAGRRAWKCETRVNCGAPRTGKSCWLVAAHDWRKHTLIPRGTPRFDTLYKKRTSVEREFSLLKDQYLLDTIRVQGLAKVATHVAFCMFVRLAKFLAERS